MKIKYYLFVFILLLSCKIAKKKLITYSVDHIDYCYHYKKTTTIKFTDSNHNYIIKTMPNKSKIWNGKQYKYFNFRGSDYFINPDSDAHFSINLDSFIDININRNIIFSGNLTHIIELVFFVDTSGRIEYKGTYRKIPFAPKVDSIGLSLCRLFPSYACPAKIGNLKINSLLSLLINYNKYGIPE